MSDLQFWILLFAIWAVDAQTLRTNQYNGTFAFHGLLWGIISGILLFKWIGWSEFS